MIRQIGPHVWLAVVVDLVIAAGVVISGDPRLIAPAVLVAVGFPRLGEVLPRGWGRTRAWRLFEWAAFVVVPSLLGGAYMLLAGMQNYAAFVVAALLVGLSWGIGIVLCAEAGDAGRAFARWE